MPAPPPTATLAEVGESDAPFEVAELYADIRAVFGVPFVVLVYRALATDAARLRRAWEAVRPNLVSGEIERLAASLAPGDERAPAAAAGALAESPLARGLVADTLSAFHRVNTRNALALAALLEGLEAAPAPPRSPAPPRDAVPAVLPMVRLDALSPRAAAVLSAFSAPIAGGGEPLVIPSLLRCLATDEALLAAVWRALEPLVGGDAFAGRVETMRDRVHTASRSLPYSVARGEDAGTREIVASFLRTIPAMVVAAPLIADALGIELGPGGAPAA